MYARMHEISIEKWKVENYLCDFSYDMERSDFESRVKRMLDYDEKDGDTRLEFRYIEGKNECLVIYSEMIFN